MKRKRPAVKCSSETMSRGPLRWSLLMAAEETGRSREFLRQGLRENGIAPDAHGCFSTRQIMAALFGDRERERILEMRDRRFERERLRLLQMGHLVEREIVDEVVNAAVGALRARLIRQPTELPSKLAGRKAPEIAEILRQWVKETLAIARAVITKPAPAPVNKMVNKSVADGT